MSTADDCVPVSPGVGKVSRWIGTVAGQVDPQGFAEMTPLSYKFLWRTCDYLVEYSLLRAV